MDENEVRDTEKNAAPVLKGLFKDAIVKQQRLEEQSEEPEPVADKVPSEEAFD